MPTYGRPHLVANALACFLAQDHPDKHLLILDDAGQLAAGGGPNWEVVSGPARYPSLTAKYNAMLEVAGLLAIPGQWPLASPCWDAVALMDDDDIYGPQWLSSHAAALAGLERWSHPRQVLSTYRGIAQSPTEPGREPSGGRFWAAAAVRVDLLARLGGFREIARPTFDQEHLALWQQTAGDPGRPDELVLTNAAGEMRLAGPQYCYGWGRAPRHVSLEMGDRENWYRNYASQVKVAVDAPINLKPRMDEQTVAVYRACWPSALV